MKVVEIVYIKNDLDYIKEFVEYYLNLGVDLIHILYFKSENDNVDIDALLSQFSKNVIIEECYSYNEHCILESYYEKYSNDYDWIMFLNCDEYLTLTKHKNIKEYLASEIFNNFEQIQINWKIYDDNDLIYNDGRKLIERFTRALDISGNIHVKPIVRGKLNKEIKNITPHFFYPLYTCDASGNDLNRYNDSLWDTTWCVNPPRYELAYIRHFMTKTIDEYVKNKMPISTDIEKRSLDFFWSINKKTPEKIEYLKKYINNNKVCICVQIKNENLYLIEFVEYYKELGFSKIFIYDNNDYEIPNLVIQKYIDEGFVELIDVRGEPRPHQYSYQDCYDKHKYEYEWFMFCDCDEYLTLQFDNTINDYLNREIFSNYSCIMINWKIMNDGDKNLCYYENKPLVERFNYENGDDGVNKHTKTILRGALENIDWRSSGTHSPIKENINTCDCAGNNIDDINNILQGPNYSLAYIRHFIVKTPTEYIFNKSIRGGGDYTKEQNKQRLTKDFYFSFSKRTPEKEKIFDNYFK